MFLQTLHSFVNCIKSNHHQNSCIFKLPAPVAAQIGPIHIDIRLLFILQRTVASIFTVNIFFCEIYST